jgi:NADPH-dependent 2,4-dienoyl-CoA reductase/sulfur reductase-like enzyme
MVIVGASLAGLRAAQAARASGFAGPLTLVGAERHLPYDRPPLSKAYLDQESEVGSPSLCSEDDLRGELAVDLRLGTRASALDSKRSVITLDDGSGSEELAYSTLVIATGAVPRKLPEDTGLSGVHTLRTVDDAAAIKEALDAGARTAVVGAGFIGSEVASAARKRALSVTVLEALPLPLVRAVGPVAARVCADLHLAHGTDLRCGVKVTGWRGDQGRVTGVWLDNGECVDADLVVVGTGVAPCTDWLAGSGLEFHELDHGILCDANLSTGVPGVFAAGDVAHFPHPLFDGMPMRLEHWTNATEQGALAARNALDPGGEQPMSSVPYFWSDWYGSRIQFVGVPDADEVRLVSEELGQDKPLALYRRGDRITGCLGIGRAGQVLKIERMIAKSKSWTEALSFAGVN